MRGIFRRKPKPEPSADDVWMAIAAKRLFMARVVTEKGANLSRDAMLGIGAYITTFDREFAAAQAAGQSANEAAVTADTIAEARSQAAAQAAREDGLIWA